MKKQLFSIIGTLITPLLVNAQLTNITAQPKSVAVLYQETVRFTISVNDTTRTTYQWYFGDQAITGATNDTLYVRNANDSKEGAYSCIAKQGSIKLNSTVANLTIKRYNNDARLGVKVNIGERSSTGIQGYMMSKVMAVDRKGNQVILGTIEPDGTLYAQNDTVTMKSVGEQDIFVASYSPAGNLRWAFSFGNPKDEKPGSIAVDYSGNTYITFTMKDSIEFLIGNKPTKIYGNKTIYNSFVAILMKIDINGNIVWAKPYGTNDTEVPQLAISDDDYLLVIGKTRNEEIDIDFSETKKLVGRKDSTAVFVAKYDLDAKLMWANEIKLTGGYSPSIYITAATIKRNTLLFGGKTTNACSLKIFDKDTIADAGSSYDGKLFMTQVNTHTGKIEKFNLFRTSSSRQNVNGLAIDSRGNIVIAGTWGSTDEMKLGFVPNDTLSVAKKGSTGSDDAFIAKFSPDYRALAAHRIFGNSQAFSDAISIDANDNIYASILSYSTTDIDPSSNVLNSNGAILLAYNPNLELLWNKNMTASSTVAADGIIISKDGYINVFGIYQTPAKLNPFEPTKSYQFTGSGSWNSYTLVFPLPLVPKVENLNLHTSAIGSTSVTLGWNAVQGATDYVVYRSLQPVASGYTDSLIVTSNTTEISSLLASTRYYFRVAARLNGKRTAYDYATAMTSKSLPTNYPIIDSISHPMALKDTVILLGSSYTIKLPSFFKTKSNNLEYKIMNSNNGIVQVSSQTTKTTFAGLSFGSSLITILQLTTMASPASNPLTSLLKKLK